MRRAALLIAGLFLSVCSLAPAQAHAELSGFELDVTGQGDVVRLTFSEPVESLGTTVVVLDPDGVAVQDGSPLVDGTAVSVTLVPLTAAGDYQVNYRVVAEDGHIVSGSERFTVTAEGLARERAPYPGLTASPETSAVLADDPRVAYWMTGFLILCGILVAAGVMRARR